MGNKKRRGRKKKNSKKHSHSHETTNIRDFFLPDGNRCTRMDDSNSDA